MHTWAGLSASVEGWSLIHPERWPDQAECKLTQSDNAMKKRDSITLSVFCRIIHLQLLPNQYASCLWYLNDFPTQRVKKPWDSLCDCVCVCVKVWLVSMFLFTSGRFSSKWDFCFLYIDLLELDSLGTMLLPWGKTYSKQSLVLVQTR